LSVEGERNFRFWTGVWQVLKMDSLEKKRKSSFSELTGAQVLKVGRSEPAATSAPFQDEAIQAVLG